MSATKSKVDLSLDEIIKSNKKSGKLNERRGAGTSRTGIKRKSTGVLKRKSAGAQKRRSVLNRSNKSNNSKASGATANKAVTQRLVNKLVKKALKRVTVGRAPKVGSVRNVVRSRRGGVRSRGGQTRNVALNRVSQRSRVIGRRSRLVNQSPAAAAAALVSSRRGRGDNRRRGTRILQANRREQNPIRAQLNFLRRQQQQSQRQVSRAPAIQQQRRPAPPQQRPQVIYVQQRRPAPVRRQPQQIVVVQQQPRRQFSRGGRRPQRRNNDPFYEPPNFLQRVPVSGGQFYGRGRGGGFGGRF